MDVNLWRSRIDNRADLVARITHLTKAETDEEAFELLWTILTEKTLKAGNGFVVAGNKVVCFQEIPLYSIVENLMFEDTLGGKKRYSWFGLRFNKIKMYDRGVRPVLYGNTNELKEILPQKEYWRIVDLNIHMDDLKNVVDWSHEREWRNLGDFQFEYDDIEVVVRNDTYYRNFVNRCIEKNRMDILKDIHGIVPLNSVIA